MLYLPLHLYSTEITTWTRKCPGENRPGIVQKWHIHSPGLDNQQVGTGSLFTVGRTPLLASTAKVAGLSYFATWRKRYVTRQSRVGGGWQFVCLWGGSVETTNVKGVKGNIHIFPTLGESNNIKIFPPRRL